MKPYRRMLNVALLILLTLLPQVRAVHAQIPLHTIEAEDSQVERGGSWTLQTTASASGGAYLYSSGRSSDVLALRFVGPSIEIDYIAGPQLGTLAVEIDDTVWRTVMTRDSQTRYHQTTRIDYLTNQAHTLRVYAQKDGVIAIDAFVVQTEVLPTHGNGDGGAQGGPFCANAPADVTHRVSVASDGTQANSGSITGDISADGRYVVFDSGASNLVAGDVNANSDIFVFDRQTCTIDLASVDSSETHANGNSNGPAITPDGRYIVFYSAATNLVAGDSNGITDIFLRDVLAGTTTRVTAATSGQPNSASFSPRISANGRFVVFESNASNLVLGDTNAVRDIFVRDLLLGTTTRVSVSAAGVEANGASRNASISDDGRTVAFTSDATNLVAEDTNGISDVFVVDGLGSTPIRRVSVATGGAQMTTGLADSPDISADGRVVAFRSTATNLVAGDTNGVEDIFVHDLQTGITTRVSLSSAGAQGTGASGTMAPSISGDGRYVTFISLASFVAGDSNGLQDIYVRDRQLGTTVRVSVSSTGGQGANQSIAPVLAANGRYVMFLSDATTLVAGDSNSSRDVFVTRNLALSSSDTLALFNPTFSGVQLINTLTTLPPATANTFYSMTPPATGQWVMGDWDGDGDDTPGVYANGPFFYTNEVGLNTVWASLWIGVAGSPVSGRFNANFDNDCIGAVQQAVLNGATVFVLYFTCDLSGNTAPTISSQWLSAVLPDSGGFSGTHQFAAGDFNGDRLDSIAVRRGDFIAFGNVAPAAGSATFDLAQFMGNPGSGSSVFVCGDWNNDGVDSFGLYYASGTFFRRDDLQFNSGLYTSQTITPLIGTSLTAHAWR